MTRIPLAKVSDKLTKVNDSFTINIYDNGFMVEVGGRDEDDEWETSKVLVSNFDDLVEVIREVTEMEQS
jgi:hypothetical protein